MLKYPVIRKLCYALYKEDWKHSHMITHQIEMDTIRDYYQGLDDLTDEEYTYAEYIEEFGYNGELYVCFNEFLENEYLMEDYIINLLDNEDLIIWYQQDITALRAMGMIS